MLGQRPDPIAVKGPFLADCRENLAGAAHFAGFEIFEDEHEQIVANAFAQGYIQTNLDLRVEPARQTNTWYEEQVKQLRAGLEAAQTALTEYQRSCGCCPRERPWYRLRARRKPRYCCHRTRRPSTSSRLIGPNPHRIA